MLLREDLRDRSSSLLCKRARFVSFRSTVGVRLRLENYKNPSKVEKRTHAAASNARVFSTDGLTRHFGRTLLTSSSSYTNRQPQTLTNNPPPGAGIGTNGGAQVDDAARKQDALSYLRHLKDRLKDRKQTYDEFLEIMKEFKAQR